MHRQQWIALLKRIDQKFHSSLVVVTSGAIEITIQNVLRMDEDVIALRGRVSGTTEAGRIYFIPYDQISYLGYNKESTESLFTEIYGAPPLYLTERQGPILDGTIQAAPEPAAPEHPPGEPPPGPGDTPIPIEITASGLRNVPSKKALLERLKARNRPSSGLPPNTSPPA